MEPAALSDYTEEARNEIFDWLKVRFSDVRDLEGFENFVYEHEGTIIRITHDSHRTPEQIRGELEFVSFLSVNKASAAAPLILPDGSHVKTLGKFQVCRFEKAAGEPLEDSFGPDLVHEWGRCIGEFHRLSRSFNPEFKRQNWLEDENHQFGDRIPADQTLVLENGRALIRDLKNLTQTDDTYGLIHSDAHPGNFLGNENGLTFFDFDDCLYTWFGYDVATILFGVTLRPWVSNDESAREKAALDFFPIFLEGYASEAPLEGLMLEHMPLFLKLREFSLYAVIYAHMDPDNIDNWFAAKFMDARRQRLEEGKSYLDVDFTQFS